MKIYLEIFQYNSKKDFKINSILQCSKPSRAISAINKKFNYQYQFGIPSKLLDYDAAGASDSWAMMVANITYSYTIEIGPLFLESETNIDFSLGFSVPEEDIFYVVRRAFVGIKEYLRTFVDRLDPKTKMYLENKCSNDYDELISDFRGYWSS